MTKMVETLINDRWSLLLPEHRAARPEWPWWEAQRLAAMFHHIGPNDVVYDIGAEEGDFPALWASWGAEVVLFEPNERVWPNIRAIFEANRLIHRLRGAHIGFAGPESRHSDAYRIRQEWPEAAYGPIIGDHGFCNLSERPDLDVVTIDECWSELGAPQPTVITMDVEGAEFEVLKGAVATLDGPRPKVFISIHKTFAWEMYGHLDVETTILRFMHAFDYEEQFLCTDHESHWFFLPRKRF
jgi:FkbM family methyltransferase